MTARGSGCFQFDVDDKVESSANKLLIRTVGSSVFQFLMDAAGPLFSGVCGGVDIDISATLLVTAASSDVDTVGDPLDASSSSSRRSDSGMSSPSARRTM